VQKRLVPTNALRVEPKRIFQLIGLPPKQLGNAYQSLRPGSHRQSAKGDCCLRSESASLHREDFRVDWAMTKTTSALHIAFVTGDRAANLEKAKGCFEAALRVYKESEFQKSTATLAANLADVERQLRNLSH